MVLLLIFSWCNPDNANCFREAFEKISVETDVHVITNGERALEFIH